MENSKRKVLILGASGMAGHIVTLYFIENNYDLFTITRKPFNLYNKNYVIDINNRGSLIKIIEDGNYDYIINCIGLLNSACDLEPDKAIFANAYLPHFIANIIKSKKTKLIHMSTDCVFSGEIGGYSENSFKDGPTLYDRTKAIGEINDNKNLTFRNSIIGPDLKFNGIGLFNWFMKQENTIEGYTKAIWNGITTITLAKAIEKVIYQDITGIYQLVSEENISKYDLLKIVNTVFRNNSIEIIPSEKIVTNKTLINNRKDFSFIVPGYEEMVIEMKKWIVRYKAIYQHYI